VAISAEAKNLDAPAMISPAIRLAGQLRKYLSFFLAKLATG
jgi:hypothetical protein